MTDIQAKSSLSQISKTLKLRGASGHNISGFTSANEHVYPYYTTTQSRSGHIIDLNDTPGSENLMIRHNSGRGINIQPDGKILISSAARADVVDGSYDLIVGTDGTLTFGNLKINVQGNLDLNVGGDFNLQAQGKTESISGDSVQLVQGNKTTTVSGNNADTIVGADTRTALAGQAIAVKGPQQTMVEGSSFTNVSGAFTQTSQGTMSMSGNATNIFGNSLAVVGGSGTIGAESILFTGLGATFGEGVSAPTFHGDLNGTAKESLVANQAATAAVGSPAPGGYTVSETAQPTITTADADGVSDLLANGLA